MQPLIGFNISSPPGDNNGISDGIESEIDVDGHELPFRLAPASSSSSSTERV